MKSNKYQIVNQLKRAIDSWDIDKAIKHSNDELTTRDFLIHPFLDVLNFRRMDDYTHEFIADMGTKRGRRVDVAITLGKNTPVILVECKKLGTILNDNHFRQLNEYFVYTPSARVGVLTNGTEFRFYYKDIKTNQGLTPDPFLTFDLLGLDASHLEILALFNRPTIDLNEIESVASEIQLIKDFEDALFNMLNSPDEEFLKLIYKKMGGKRSSADILAKINSMLNSVSVKSAYERIVQHEISNSNSGIVTTEEELKAFTIIKTILTMSRSIKNQDLDRIGFRDMKTAFAVIVDDNQRKQICSLRLKERIKLLLVNGVQYELDAIDASSLSQFKKELVNSASICLAE